MKRITYSLLLIAALGLLTSCDSDAVSDDSSGNPIPDSGYQPPRHTLRMVGYFDSAHGTNFFEENFGQCHLSWPGGHMDLASATVSVGQGDSLHFSFDGHAYNSDQSWYPVHHELTVVRNSDQIMSAVQAGDEPDWFLIAGADPVKPYGLVLTDASAWDLGLDFYQPNCQSLVFGQIAGRPQVELPKSWVDKSYVLKNLRYKGEDKQIDRLSAGNRYMRFTLTGAQLDLELNGSYRLTHQSIQWSPTSGHYEKEEVIEGFYWMDKDVLIMDLTKEFPSYGRVSADTLVVIDQREWFILDHNDFVFVEE